MKDNGLLDISICQIKLFLLLAEIRNFSKVAALTNIAQPTLSKRISQLEQILNMQLFVRNIRPIRLTQEGEILYDGWTPLCSLFDEAVKKAIRRKNYADL